MVGCNGEIKLYSALPGCLRTTCSVAPVFVFRKNCYANFGDVEIQKSSTGGGLTDAERTEIVGDILPMTFRREIRLMLDPNVGMFFRFLVKPVPARAVRLAAGKGMKIV